MTKNVNTFLERFARFGAAPGRQTYLALFHADATLLDAGMERPLRTPEIGDHIEQVLMLARDFRMIPERWRAAGNAVFVEAYNEARVADTPLRWRSVYAIELRGDLVIRGRRYYDRAPLFAALDPHIPKLPNAVPRLPGEGQAGGALAGNAPVGAVRAPQTAAEFVRVYSDCWAIGDPEALAELYREDASMMQPGMVRPLGRADVAGHYRALRALVPDLQMELRDWAGDEHLVLAEWQARGILAGKPFQLGIADRFDLVDGRVLNARAYFDTLSLAAAVA